MCNFKILAQNTDGYVVSCESCRAIQFAFGTTLAKMSVAGFLELAELIRLECVSRMEAETVNVKSIVIPLEESAMLCLTLQELQKLELLLQQASAIFETYRILDSV